MFTLNTAGEVTVIKDSTKTFMVPGDEIAAKGGKLTISVPGAKPTDYPFTATPCPSSGVAGASSSAGGALAVTGSSTTIVAGVALLILGAGTGFFLVARRRRIRFTTS